MNSENLTSLWREYSFSEIAKKDKFAIVDGPFGTQLHSDEYTETGIPLVRIENLSFSGKFSPENLVFISEKKANQLNRSRVVPGDLIIAKTGATIGKSGMFPKTFTDGIIASSCMKVSCDPKKVDPKLILYMIVWENGQKKILEGAGGSTRTSINIGPFSDIRLLIPESISEQHKIAEILTTVDDAIEQTEALIRKYQRIKHGVFSDFLDNSGQKWPYEKLSSFYSEPSRNGLYKSPSYYGDVYKMIHMPQMFGSDVVNPTNAAKVNLTIQELRTFRLQEDDLLFARRSLNFEGAGKCSLVSNLQEEVAFESSIIRVRLRRNLIRPRFINLFLNSDYGMRMKNIFIRQVAVSGVSSEDVGNYLVPHPSILEKDRINNIMSGIEQNIDLTIRCKEKLYKIRQGLMQDLLTGKVRANALLE